MKKLLLAFVLINLVCMFSVQAMTVHVVNGCDKGIWDMPGKHYTKNGCSSGRELWEMPGKHYTRGACDSRDNDNVHYTRVKGCCGEWDLKVW